MVWRANRAVAERREGRVAYQELPSVELATRLLQELNFAESVVEHTQELGKEIKPAKFKWFN